MSRNSRAARRMRGGALVEFVIMVIILVPIIMYYLFLQDALYFKLNAQEPVVAAPFDHLTVNYNMPTQGAVGKMNRLIYCDHSSAYDSFNGEFDCQGSPPEESDPYSMNEDPTSVQPGTDKGHHTEKGAHQCWITEGAQQLRCTRPNATVGAAILASGSGSSWLSYYNRGGLTTCSARIGVMNYIIINRFFSWSARGQELTGGNFGTHELKHNQRWAHADYREANENNQILMPKQHLAVLTDPWALNHLQDVTPNDNAPQTSSYRPGENDEGVQENRAGSGQLNRLSNRTGTYYHYYGNNSKSGGEAPFASVNDFFEAAKRDFLDDSARIDGVGDEPESVPILYKAADVTRAAPKEGFASGWADNRQAGIRRGATYPTNW